MPCERSDLVLRERRQVVGETCEAAPCLRLLSIALLLHVDDDWNHWKTTPDRSTFHYRVLWRCYPLPPLAVRAFDFLVRFFFGVLYTLQSVAVRAPRSGNVLPHVKKRKWGWWSRRWLVGRPPHDCSNYGCDTDYDFPCSLWWDTKTKDQWHSSRWWIRWCSSVPWWGRKKSPRMEKNEAKSLVALLPPPPDAAASSSFWIQCWPWPDRPHWEDLGVVTWIARSRLLPLPCSSFVRLVFPLLLY